MIIRIFSASFSNPTLTELSPKQPHSISSPLNIAMMIRIVNEIINIKYRNKFAFNLNLKRIPKPINSSREGIITAIKLTRRDGKI
jgi:hypothetical protein